MTTVYSMNSRSALVMAALMGVVFCGTSAMAAATRTWDGDTSPNWSDTNNWDVAPVSGDSLTFPVGALNQSNTNDVAAIKQIGTLTLSNGGWDIDLGNLNTAQIGTGVFGIQATGNSTLRGDFSMGDADRMIALNGPDGTTTLTIADKFHMYRANNTMTLTVNGAGNTLLLGRLAIGAAGGNKTINGTANVTVTGAVTETISGSLTWSGSGTLTLNGASSYDSRTIVANGTMLVNGSIATSPMTISGGTLALGSAGSISNVPSLSIGAGGTFDVSAQSAYSLGPPLTASGTAGSPATIKGASGGTVSLGGQAVTLKWSGASSGVDSTNPPLTIVDATLVLNNDPLTVNVPGDALGEGVYTLISAPDGGITGTVNSTPTYSGSGQETNGVPEGVMSIIDSSVILTIAIPPKGGVIIVR